MGRAARRVPHEFELFKTVVFVRREAFARGVYLYCLTMRHSAAVAQKGVSLSVQPRARSLELDLHLARLVDGHARPDLHAVDNPAPGEALLHERVEPVDARDLPQRDDEAEALGAARSGLEPRGLSQLYCPQGVVVGLVRTRALGQRLARVRRPGPSRTRPECPASPSGSPRRGRLGSACRFP